MPHGIDPYGKRLEHLLDRCSPGFELLLEPYLLDAAERHAATVYGMWPDFRLAYFNPAWSWFAHENGADPVVATESYLGTSVLEVTPEVLRPFYGELFRACLNGMARRNRPIQHLYECSSAGLFREFVMTLYCLRGAAGLLVVHALVVECPHDPERRPSRVPHLSAYLDADGLIHQCTHCRRTRNLEQPDRWDWVPAWVERIPRQSSHTLCEFCLQQYYLEPRHSVAGRPATAM